MQLYVVFKLIQSTSKRDSTVKFTGSLQQVHILVTFLAFIDFKDICSDKFTKCVRDMLSFSNSTKNEYIRFWGAIVLTELILILIQLELSSLV